MSRRPAKIDDVRWIPLPRHIDGSGTLVAMTAHAEVPFDIRRIFHVFDVPAGGKRGGHAHRQTAQLACVIRGRCNFVCDDGANRRTFALTAPDSALFVPPGIWGEQEYLDAGTVLAVACDSTFDENDYLRVYEEFRRYRHAMLSSD